MNQSISLKGMNFTVSPKSLLTAMFAVALLLVLATAAQAGTGGAEFDGIWTLIKGWMQGTLGRVIAGGMVLTGLIAGWARGSLFAAVAGVGMGLCLFYGPTIIEAVVTATF
jgi:conjugal transfer pilus assembly protein TraA